MTNRKNNTKNTKDPKPRATKRRQKAGGATKLRKSEGSIDRMSIVSDYADGILTVSEIATKHNTTIDNVNLITTRFWKTLCNTRESRLLLGYADSPKAHFDQKNALEALRKTNLVNQEFLDLLSDPDTALLSEAEAIYCWHYVHSGDLRGAIKTAGLDVGLHRDKGEQRDSRYSFDQAMVMRSKYLNAKPNIVAYITQLREDRLIDADVGKSKIQTELIDQLEQMKAAADPYRYRTQMLRTIELLGKTVGAFVDRVEVTEVNPNDALDRLIEMAQEAEVTESPKEIEVTQ